MKNMKTNKEIRIQWCSCNAVVARLILKMWRNLWQMHCYDIEKLWAVLTMKWETLDVLVTPDNHFSNLLIHTHSHEHANGEVFLDGTHENCVVCCIWMRLLQFIWQETQNFYIFHNFLDIPVFQRIRLSKM